MGTDAGRSRMRGEDGMELELSTVDRMIVIGGIVGILWTGAGIGVSIDKLRHMVGCLVAELMKNRRE